MYSIARDGKWGTRLTLFFVHLMRRCGPVPLLGRAALRDLLSTLTFTQCYILHECTYLCDVYETLARWGGGGLRERERQTVFGVKRMAECVLCVSVYKEANKYISLSDHTSSCIPEPSTTRVGMGRTGRKD